MDRRKFTPVLEDLLVLLNDVAVDFQPGLGAADEANVFDPARRHVQFAPAGMIAVRADFENVVSACKAIESEPTVLVRMGREQNPRAKLPQ